MGTSQANPATGVNPSDPSSPELSLPNGKAGGAISWHVVGNFRLFKNEIDVAYYQDLIKKAATINTDDLFADRSSIPDTYYDDNTGSYTVFNEGTGTYSDSENYVSPKRWRIALTYDAGGGGQCEWIIDGESKGSGSCKDFIVEVEGPKHEIAVRVAGGTQSVTQKIVIQDILVAAIGDSWMAGEGNPDVTHVGHIGLFTKRAAQWLGRNCHRSLYSWPVLSAIQLASNHPQASVTLLDYACTGATIDKGILGTHLGAKEEETFRSQPPIARFGSDTFGSEPEATDAIYLEQRKRSQIDKLKTDLQAGKGRRPDVVLVSIGGNDVGFVKIVVKTEILNEEPCSKDPNHPNQDGQFAEKLKRLTNDLDRVRQEIVKLAPDADVFLSTYPSPLRLNADQFCDDPTAHSSGKTREFGGLVDFFVKGITAEEAKCASEQIVTPLNEALRRFAKNHQGEKWRVIDTDGLKGHGYCAPNPQVQTGAWFNTLKDAHQRCGSMRGSMHPNLFGHLFYVEHAYPIINTAVTRRLTER
ncbi:MAG: hypothetical protein HQL66_05330 [Magnetococcales bacterium]|nr:hypothetical protein [Magnetococcales bacterium]